MYRSYYAIKPLFTSGGTPTQATYGFFRAFKKIMDDFHPTNIIVAWDSKGPTFRNEMYTAYKATRSAPPSDLFVQKEHIQKVLDAMGVCQMAQPGFEADDVIAAIAQKFRPDYQIVLVCPDKDMYQLMGKNLLVFDPFKNRLFDQAEYEQELGFPTEKLPFYYSLLGDASDNIPGVRGIGKKGALDLVVQFDSLDDLYANIDNLEKERTRKSLLEYKDDAYLSYQLFLLKPF
jgi:DNA polymerase-1